MNRLSIGPDFCDTVPAYMHLALHGHMMRRGRLASALRLGFGTAKATSMHDHWEHFEHGADIGVRGIAATKAGAFEQAALALTAVATDPQGVALQHSVQIRCEAPDDELLLAHWLNAVASEMAARRLVFGNYRVQLDGRRLVGVASGEPVSARHQPAVEVKGATCTALRVAPHHGGWLAQTVVDV